LFPIMSTAAIKQLFGLLSPGFAVKTKADCRSC